MRGPNKIISQKYGFHSEMLEVKYQVQYNAIRPNLEQ